MRKPVSSMIPNHLGIVENAYMYMSVRMIRCIAGARIVVRMAEN